MMGRAWAFALQNLKWVHHSGCYFSGFYRSFAFPYLDIITAYPALGVCVYSLNQLELICIRYCRKVVRHSVLNLA